MLMPFDVFAVGASLALVLLLRTCWFPAPSYCALLSVLSNISVYPRCTLGSVHSVGLTFVVSGIFCLLYVLDSQTCQNLYFLSQ